MTYDEAFRSILRAGFMGLPLHERSRAESDDRHGKLWASDPRAFACHDAYKFHRAHADTFRVALDACSFTAEPHERICVVDIGAGAGTVAAALLEHCSERHPQQLLYVGVEPHEAMRALGRDFVSAIGRPWFEHGFHADFDWALPEADRYVVTLSYVVHQPSIPDRDIAEWARRIAAMLRLGPVTVLLTTIDSADPVVRRQDRTPQLRAALQAQGIAFDEHTERQHVGHRFPRTMSEGWEQKRQTPSDWKNVRIDRYELRECAPPAVAT